MNKASVPALEKAIRILHAIASNSGETTSSALARKIDASQPTTYRILKTLEAADWIKANPHNGYSLSLGLLPLLHHLDDFSRYGRAAQAWVNELSADLDLTTKFTIRQVLEQIIIATAQPVRPWGVSVPLGGRFPVVWGSPGACLLASQPDADIESVIGAIPEKQWKHEKPEFLRRRIEEVRRTRLCESLGEHYLGLDTLSTPVPTPMGTAALTIVGFKGEMTPKNLSRFRTRLLEAAQKLETALHEA